ncbi:DUF2809 domain-containing protein [candidate division KSB1 bacterium]|nr:DUF2809 domain-containing protein [candidate division KSB1 bacterium]
MIYSLIVLIPVGFYSKFYNGPLALWVNNSLGGLFYVVFWIFLFCLIFPRVNKNYIILWVVFVTCILEFSQLCHAPILEWIRSCFIGRTLIGNSFHWNDMLYYVLGGLVCWIWINLMERRITK